MIKKMIVGWWLVVGGWWKITEILFWSSCEIYIFVSRSYKPRFLMQLKSFAVPVWDIDY